MPLLDRGDQLQLFSVDPGQTQDDRQGSHDLTGALACAINSAHSDFCPQARRAAAQIWAESTKSKLTGDWLYDKILSNPQVQYTLVPQNTMKYADFMKRVAGRPGDGVLGKLPEDQA